MVDKTTGELDFKSIIEFIKITVLLPIGMLAYQLEKFGPIYDSVNFWLFWITFSFFALSIVTGLYSLMPLTAAPSYEKILQSEIDEEKKNLYIGRLEQNTKSIRLAGSIHTLCLLFGAAMLMFITILNLENLYKKPDDTKNIAVSMKETEVVASLNRVNRSIKEFETILRSLEANSDECNALMNKLLIEFSEQEANLDKLTVENEAHLDRHLDIITEKINTACSIPPKSLSKSK